MRPKLIYLARRNPALTPESFVARWRRHGALGMSLPRWRNVWRYAHNDVVADGLGVSSHDGVGVVWHRSPEARRAHREDRLSQGAMERDELETFDDFITRSCALYEEEVVVPPERWVRSKLIRFWDAVPATLPDEAAHAAGFVRNHRLPPEADAWGLACPVVDELWFDNPGEARSLAAADRGPMGLVVEETVLYRSAEG